MLVEGLLEGFPNESDARKFNFPALISKTRIATNSTRLELAACESGYKESFDLHGLYVTLSLMQPAKKQLRSSALILSNPLEPLDISACLWYQTV